MVFPSGFVKVVLSGTTLQGAEIFSTSLSVLPPFTSGDRADELRADFLPALTDAAQRWFGRPGSFIHTSASLTTIKANMVGADGKYISESETVYVDLPPGTTGGQSNAPLLPPQCTLAVSLRTDAARGLASRGRFFPPALAGAVEPATGMVSTSQAEQIAASAKTFLDAINAVDGYRVVVASDVREGAIRPVTRVEVGTVVDTQRRRRSALIEKYSGTDVAP